MVGESLEFFIKGIVMGFLIAVPVGPIGILCIRRTLYGGMLYGCISGLGTAMADAVYGSIAAFGITIAARFLVENQFYLQLIGGVFLLYLGYVTFQSEPTTKTTMVSSNSYLGCYTSAFFLTLTNPLTILAFAAVFAGLGIGEVNGNYWLASILVMGVFLGSMLWWLLLSGLVNSLRDKFNPQKLKWVSHIAGIVIAAFGVISLVNL